MAYQKYTEAELQVFKARDKRIMWQSIFAALCSKLDEEVSVIVDRTTRMVSELEARYPSEEAEKTPEYKEAELDEAIADTEKRLTQLKNIKSGQPF